MLSPNLVSKLAPAILLAAAVILPGCSINVKDKNKDGESRVDIKTPMGDLHVNEQPDVKETGLTVYPGAKPATKDSSSDKKSANVNISAGGFSLKVVAAEFQSDDPSDKILAYYNKELQHFGKPIECHGRWSGGGFNTELGKKNGSKPVSCGTHESGESIELKVGTDDNQHVVAVKPDGKGTRFALVYVRAHTGSEDTI